MLLALAGLVADEAEGEARAREAVRSGAGLAKLRAVVAAQGGDVTQIDDPARLPHAPWRALLEAPSAGYIAAIDAEQVGRAAVRLGAGRMRKGEAIDPAVGFVLRAKVGDRVEQGQPLVEIHARSKAAAARVRDQLVGAYTWSDEPVASPPLLLGTVARAATSHTITHEADMTTMMRPTR